VSWFTFDDDRALRNFNQLSQRLIQVRREVYTAQRRVLEAEYEEGLALSPGIVDAFHGVALNWSRGFSLGGLVRRIDLAEGDLLVILNQTIDLLQQVHGAVAQTLDARDIWQSARPDTRRGRYLAEVRARLARLRPGLDAAWRGMLRGSVAQSRAIPSMITPAAGAVSAEAAEAGLPPVIPPIPMAEDDDPDVARSARVEREPPAAARDGNGPADRAAEPKPGTRARRRGAARRARDAGEGEGKAHGSNRPDRDCGAPAPGD
jgi:hypothetical protein